jgi:hypothetical protein
MALRRRSLRSAAGPLAGAALGLAALLVAGCGWDGNFTILGYTTRPNYDTRYKTVRVRIFRNPTFWSVVPVPGLEEQLTQALVREIELKTPYKVVSGDADTEVVGNIKSFSKSNVLNYNQMFEQRETETILVADVLWRDLRTGQFLTLPPRTPGVPLPPDALPPPPALAPVPGPGPDRGLAPVPATPTSPLNNGIIGPNTPPTSPAAAVPVPTPVGPPGSSPVPGYPLIAFQPVRATAYFRPELGESITTAQQRNVDRMAVQIVSMMEKPW